MLGYWPLFLSLWGKNQQTLWCFAKRILQKCRDNLTPSVEGFAMAIRRILTFLRKFQDLQPETSKWQGKAVQLSVFGLQRLLRIWLTWFLQEMASIKKLLGCPMFSKKNCSTFSISFGLKHRGTQDLWWFPTTKQFFQFSSLWCVLQVLPITGPGEECQCRWSDFRCFLVWPMRTDNNFFWLGAAWVSKNRAGHPSVS